MIGRYPSAPSLQTAREPRNKATLWLLVAALGTLVTAALVYFIRPLFHSIAQLEDAGFLLASLVVGLGLALGPLAAVVGMLVFLFQRVEACLALPRGSWAASDRAIVACAVLVSLAPSLAALYPPTQALLSGYIGFRGPGQQYLRAEDPYGFWQAVAFWLMGAATLAVIAGVYWRAKWRITHQSP